MLGGQKFRAKEKAWGQCCLRAGVEMHRQTPDAPTRSWISVLEWGQPDPAKLKGQVRIQEQHQRKSCSRCRAGVRGSARRSGEACSIQLSFSSENHAPGKRKLAKYCSKAAGGRSQSILLLYVGRQFSVEVAIQRQGNWTTQNLQGEIFPAQIQVLNKQQNENLYYEEFPTMRYLRTLHSWE